jgi:hypothetical protein
MQTAVGFKKPVPTDPEPDGTVGFRAQRTF